MINEFESSMYYIVGTSRKMMLKQLNDALVENEIPLTFEQFVFLYKLYKQPQPVTQQNMADCTGKDKSAVLRTIEILEKKCLVLRSDDPNDRRKKIVTISGKCEELFEQIVSVLNTLMDQLKQGISESDYAVMVKVMYQVQANSVNLSKN